ncbi:hypothetical protein, partial [Corynebacterium sp. MSK039]|uniref:hypothetical protein n=1 Tax=Corynebacterium sp. MSK039 TaxID=3050193 RepID=UPI00254BB831
SLASWSNFFGMFQIFPSTQTEQNLGHFKAPIVLASTDTSSATAASSKTLGHFRLLALPS